MLCSFASRDSVEGAFNSTRLFCSVPFDREMQTENRPKSESRLKDKNSVYCLAIGCVHKKASLSVLFSGPGMSGVLIEHVHSMGVY